MEQTFQAVPLAALWLLHEAERPRAGSLGKIVFSVRNYGSATWRSRDNEGIHIAYHWLDPRGNAIVWDGVRTPFDEPVAPGEWRTVAMEIRAPIPPGPYRLQIDLVDEGRLWFAEVGNEPLDEELDVQPRIERKLAVRGGDPDALAAQEEALVDENEASAVAYLGPESAPAADWSRRVLDAHQEGYAIVGGSLAWDGGRLSRRPREFARWAPGTGRIPGFPDPLVCPSVVTGVEPRWTGEVDGLPTARAPVGEPSIYDGRIVVTARPRSDRRRG